MATWSKRLELPQTTEHNRWINYDIRPVEAARRTWGFVSFHNYWLLVNTNISTYLTGSALIPLGLTWWQALICIIIGNLLAALFVILNSLPGAYYHVGFPIVNRMVWGMWGAQFVIWNRIFLALDHIPNHMSANTGMTTAQFVAYILFCVISLPVIWIRPHRLQRFFYFASSVTIVFFFAFLTWALATMGQAGFGDTISNSADLPSTGGPNSVAWLMVYGIMTSIGSIAAAVLSQNDYARFATQPKHAILGQTIAFPVYGIICSVIGILTTAATQNRFGEAVWNPPTVFSQLIAQNPGSTGTRAACFFGGLALVVSQIGVNVPGNALSGGFDLAATFPRHINIRRGAYLTAVFSIAVNPWRLVNTATTFLTVLSSYSVFLGSMTGMMVASYLVVSRRKIQVDHLYCGNSSSIYWFSYGINWRAPAAWIFGFAPLMPGFIAAVQKSAHVSKGAIELYHINYAYGFLSSAVIFVFLHRIFPAASLDAFVQNGTTPQETVSSSMERWDSAPYESGSVYETNVKNSGTNGNAVAGRV